MKSKLENVVATLFGGIFLAFAVLVAVETVSRKLFNYSFQGVDELGGYALAVGSTLAFSLALIGRNHIRIDVFHELLPRWLQALMNWLSIVLLAAFAIFMAYLSFQVLSDTLAYRSTAQTPWATPLIYPQSVWYAGQIIFVLLAVGLTLRATWLLANGHIDTLNTDFHPKSSKEELTEELEDIAVRNVASQGADK